LTKRKGTGNFEQWQNVGKYYLRVSAPKTQCPGATSAPCTCELQRKPLPSRKRNRRSEAAAISVILADQNPYLIRRRRSADDVVTVRRDGVEDHLDQIAWRAGLFMVNGGNTANDFRFLTSVSRPAAPCPIRGFLSLMMCLMRYKGPGRRKRARMPCLEQGRVAPW
jgi:hypothetical protein